MKINEKFINLIKNRDSEAFELVYNEFFDVLFYTSFKIVKSKDDALDVAQDVFYKLWEKADELRSDNHGSFVSWLLTVTRNMSINRLNQNKRIVYDEEIVMQSPSEKDDTLIKYNDFINLCSGLIPEEEIDIVIYHAYYGKTFKEISFILNKPTSTISSKFYSSIEKIREVLK
ncbi:MAG TPA: sigma-70 family RNA polymerase sigma factor [Acholeplasmataceae bacterium]|nr:sigma-70 family RNA polymerase sigma factor [Acholeplasmataceae bacterium]